MRVGVLTGGGDCPGLNAVIRAVVRKGVKEYGFEFVGFRDGWRGPLEDLTTPLGIAQVRGILPARRHDPRLLAHQPVQDRGRRGADQGEPRRRRRRRADRDRRRGHARRRDQAADLGVNVVGVPKTIDNDLNATDFTFGFDTAVNIAMEAIDRLHTTAESHHRVLVVEVMGRHAGWIALHAGLAGGANVVLIPEQPFDIDAVCALVEQRFETHYSPIIVVSEGAVPVEGGDMTLVTGEKDAFGHVRLGGIGDRLAKRDRAPHRQGGARRRARARPARRHADRVRPLAGHPLRAARHRRRRRRRLRHDGGAARHRHRAGAAGRGHRRAQAGPARRSTPRPRSSSADRASLAGRSTPIARRDCRADAGASRM